MRALISSAILSETFPILRRNERDMIKSFIYPTTCTKCSFNVEFNVRFNILLEHSNCAFSWINKRLDDIKDARYNCKKK
jgi:hypothetical protein